MSFKLNRITTLHIFLNTSFQRFNFFSVGLILNHYYLFPTSFGLLLFKVSFVYSSDYIKFLCPHVSFPACRFGFQHYHYIILLKYLLNLVFFFGLAWLLYWSIFLFGPTIERKKGISQDFLRIIFTVTIS